MNNHFKFLCAIILLLTSLNTYAEKTGLYIGGSVGLSNFEDLGIGDKFKVGDEGYNAESPDAIRRVPNLNHIPAAGVKYDSKKKAMAWKFFGGYNLNQYVGIEAGYVSLGRREVEAAVAADHAAVAAAPAADPPVAAIPAFPKGTYTFAAGVVSGWTAVGVGRFPVAEKVNLFGKAGVFVWKGADHKFSADDDKDKAVNEEYKSANDDGASILFGAGVEYELQSNISIRAEWERYTYNITRDEKGDDQSVHLFSLGVAYSF